MFMVNLTLTFFLEIIRNMAGNTLTSSLIVINDKSVSFKVTEKWQIEIFPGEFDLDLIFQGHPK